MTVARTRGLHPKAAGATVGGAVVTLVVACLAWAGIDVPLDVGSAAATLGALLGAYIAPRQRNEAGHTSIQLAWAVTIVLLGLIWLTLLFRWHAHTG